MVFVKSVIPVKKILWLQWIAGLGAMLATFTVSLMIGWTSPFLAKLTTEDSPLPITAEEASWVAAFLNLGRLAGAVIGGVSVEYFGSKQTLAILGFPLTVSYVCTIVANSVHWLYVARITAGVSLGMTFSSFPIYLGEVSDPMIRGSLITLTMTGMSLGILIGNTLGAYLSMTLFASVSLVPNVVTIILFLWLPQSPHYLVRLGRIDDAAKSITRYNPKVDPKVEVESIKNFMSTSDSLTFSERLREFNVPRNRKAGLIALVLFFFVQFSGINSVIFYQEILMTSAMVSVIAPATVVMLTSTVGVLSGWIAIVTADKFERRVLMMAGSAGVVASTCALGAHFALLKNGSDPETLQWLPITAMLLLAFSVCSGLGSVPSMLISELFVPEIKGLAACFASVAVGLFGFIATKSYQPLVAVIGESYVFWSHTVLMITCIVFSGIFVPRTRGKSLQEIQDTIMSK